MANDQVKLITLSHVSVVIPTYNGQHLLEKNLPQVFKMLRDGDEVVIVDDDSHDATISWLTQTFSLTPAANSIQSDEHGDFKIYEGCLTLKSVKLDVKLCHNLSNTRFGAAANRGVKLSAHDFVFLINNDVVPYQDVISHLLPYFQDKSMFAVGCYELETHSGLIGGKNKLWFERGMFTHSRVKDTESGPTAWASGGSSLFRKSYWLKLDGFDHRFYPAYWEDVDLSFRARKAGWQVWFAEDAKVHHNHESTNQDVFGQNKIDTMSRKNALKFTWIHSNPVQKLLFLIWQPYYWFRRKRIW